MPGCILKDTLIAVDFWNIRRAPSLKVFFLTHMHSDHVEGLTSTWPYPIYCSEISACLLKSRLGLPERVLRPLSIAERHLIRLEDDLEDTITVTVLDAHHCPGAVMYLFEGSFGTALVTGDFRFCPEMQQDLTSFVRVVDTLYLDNTFCDPRCTFSPREDYVSEIISVIERHSDQRILIGIHSLGKEELLVHIAKATQSWIVVPPDRMTMLTALALPMVFTTDTNESRIHVVCLSNVNSENIRRWTAECDTIIILATALYSGLDGKPFCNHSNVFIVPYSDHSCYEELRKFVGIVKPKIVIPLVKYTKRGPLGTNLQHRANMDCFNDLLDMSPVLPLVTAYAAKGVTLEGATPVHSSHRLSGGLLGKRCAARTPAVSRRRRLTLGVTYVDQSLAEFDGAPSPKRHSAAQSSGQPRELLSQGFQPNREIRPALDNDNGGPSYCPSSSPERPHFAGTVAAVLSVKRSSLRRHVQNSCSAGSFQRRCATRILAAARRRQFKSRAESVNSLPTERSVALSPTAEFSVTSLCGSPVSRCSLTVLECSWRSHVYSLSPETSCGGVAEKIASEGGHGSKDRVESDRLLSGKSGQVEADTGTKVSRCVEGEEASDGRDNLQDDFVSLFVPPCLRIHRNDVLASIMDTFSNMA